MARPRAANDFPAIRARMEELRRERVGVAQDHQPIADAQPYAITVKRVASPAMQRVMRELAVRRVGALGGRGV